MYQRALQRSAARSAGRVAEADDSSRGWLRSGWDRRARSDPVRSDP